MRIVNNKIHIMKGETPTYTAVYRDAKTGEPFKIPHGFTHPVVKFIVRDSVYDLGAPRFEGNMDLDKTYNVYGDGYRFDEDVATYKLPDPITSYDWDDNYFGTYTTASKTALYRKLNANGEYEYAYFGNDNTWHEYSFKLMFPLPYEKTSAMEPKTYSYEITLFDYANQTGTDNFDEHQVLYKKPILAPTEFIVGGTLSE